MDVDAATKADLVQDAADLGVEFTERTVTSWCERGLLDSPQRRGAGRGRGSQPALFGPMQRKLFRALVQKRRQQPEVHLHTLALIPLYLWIYWGDDYVPLRQAHLALKTWVRGAHKVSMAGAKAVAEQAINSIADRKAPSPEKKELLTVLTSAVYTGRFQDVSNLERLLDIVTDPDGTGQRIGPPPFAIDHLVLLRTLLMRAAASQQAARAGFSDETLVEARHNLRKSACEYLAMQPELIASVSADVQERFPLQLTDDELLMNAGSHLLLVCANIDGLLAVRSAK